MKIIGCNNYINVILYKYPLGVFWIKEVTVMNCCKTKKRNQSEYKRLINRLNRIEGQIRGIKGMVEKDSYCVDILTQVSAVNAALNAFNKELLSEHIKTCVKNDIQEGNDTTIDELVDILQKLMK